LDHQSSSSFCHCFELRCLWAWKSKVYLIKFHLQSSFEWNRIIWKKIEATICFSMQFITYFVWDLYFVMVIYINVCHYIWSFYRWCSIPTWILLLCFKGKDFFSFMNVVFSIILKLLTHNVSDIMCSSFCNSLKWNRYMSTVHFPPLTQIHDPRDFRIPHLILINFHIN
jgi:hypothetical protein